jgi:transcriptional regulator with XRE-family HTH domain
MARSALANLLRTWRESTIDPTTGRSYTQPGLAEAVGVSKSAIGAIENEETKSITPDLANRVSRVLGVPVADFCRAMGYDVESARLTPLEAEAVQLLRRLPDERATVLVDMIRGAATGALRTPARRAPYDLQERAPRTKVADRGRE